MKKMIAAAAAIILTAGLCGCAGGSGTVSAVITETQDGSSISAAGLNITLPQDWEAYVGKDVYEKLYEGSEGGYDSADDLKKSYEDNGTSYLVYAVNSEQTAMLSFSALKITTDENGERLSAEEFARTNHDTSVITFQASGLKIANSGFSEESIGGRSGYLSKYEVYSDEETSQLLMGQSEFIFEQDGSLYSLQVYYHSPEAGQQTSDILSGITAAE